MSRTAAYEAERSKERRETNKRYGICIRCYTKDAKKGRLRCPRCLKKCVKEARRVKMLAALEGYCSRCCKTKVEQFGKRCRPCMDWFAAKDRQRTARRRCVAHILVSVSLDTNVSHSVLIWRMARYFHD